MEENTLACMNARLDRLEHLVNRGSQADSTNSCLDALMNVQSKLQSSVTGKEKITLLFNKMNELEKYLSPTFKENLTMDSSVKVNLLLLDEDNVRRTVDALQTVKDLSQFLESEHIRGVPSLFPKLQNVLETQKTLQEKSLDLSAETRQLIEDYDNIILSLSKQFILWDSMLTDIEKAKQSGTKIE